MDRSRGFYANNVDTNYSLNSLAHEAGWISYAPNPYPRWIGLVFSGKL